MAGVCRKMAFAAVLLAGAGIIIMCGNEALPETMIPTGAQKLAQDLNTLFYVNSRSNTQPVAAVVDENIVCIYPAAKITKPIIENNTQIIITIPKGVVLDLNWNDNLTLSSNGSQDMRYQFDGAGTIRAENLNSLILDKGVKVTIKDSVTLESKCEYAVFIRDNATLTMDTGTTLYYVNNSIKWAAAKATITLRSDSIMILANPENTTDNTESEVVAPISEIPGKPSKLIIQENVQFSPSQAIELNNVVLDGILSAGFGSSSPVKITVKGTFVFADSGRIRKDPRVQIEFSKGAMLIGKKIKKMGSGKTQPTVTTSSNWSFSSPENIAGYLEEIAVDTKMEEGLEGNGVLTFKNSSTLTSGSNAKDLSGTDAFLISFN